MLEFKSAEDLSKLSPDDPAFPIVEDLIKRLITEYIAEGYEYIPADDGWIVLIEPEDVDRELDELWEGCTLLSIYWEGISKQGDFFIAIYLANNQYGLCFVIPDAPWVNGELRKIIEDNLDPTTTETQETTT